MLNKAGFSQNSRPAERYQEQNTSVGVRVSKNHQPESNLFTGIRWRKVDLDVLIFGWVSIF
jgi:hypothetical protein